MAAAAKRKTEVAGHVPAPVQLPAGVLAGALNNAAAIVQRSQSIPILANVRLIAGGGALDITTSDLDMEYRQRIDLGGDMDLATTVDARMLASMAGAVPADTQMTLEMDGARLLVRTGRSRWRLPALGVQDFPVMPFEAETMHLQLPADALRSALERVLPFICTELSRPHIGGCFLHEFEGHAALVATNGHGLMRVKMDAPWPEESEGATIPLRFAKTLARHLASRETPVPVMWDKRKLRLTLGQIVLTGKLIDMPFPDYHRVIPSPGECAIVDPAMLRDAARRVALIASEKTRKLKISQEQAGLMVSTLDEVSGESSEEVPANCSAGHQTGFNARYLDDMLAALGGDSIEIHQQDEGSPARFQRVVPDGAVGVIMPMRF